MTYRNWNDGQEITFGDLNAASKALMRQFYDRAFYEMVQRKSDAFFGDGFLVEFATATSITVRPGVGFQEDNGQANPEPTKRLLYKASSSPISIPTPDASLDRIDIVVVKATEKDDITASRKFKDAILLTISNQNLVVQKDWDLDLQIIAGTPSATPSEPATPSGYIKLASLFVTTVTGLSGAGAVTDSRINLPLAGDMLIDSLAYVSGVPTKGAETKLKTILTEFDSLLLSGEMETNLWPELDQSAVTALGTPAAGYQFMYNKDGNYFTKNSSGDETPLGSGAGGGGGGLKWNGIDGSTPPDADENGEFVYLFEKGQANKLTVWLKVPQGYLAGRQIKMYHSAYSPAAVNDWKIQTVSTLVRKNFDAVTDLSNQLTTNTGDITNTIASQYRQVSTDITNASGEINSVVVQPGDLIRVELSRIAPAGTEDTEDVRFVPSATEVTFA